MNNRCHRVSSNDGVVRLSNIFLSPASGMAALFAVSVQNSDHTFYTFFCPALGHTYHVDVSAIIRNAEIVCTDADRRIQDGWVVLELTSVGHPHQRHS